MSKEIGCRFKNKKSGKIKDMWLSKTQFERLSYEFLQEWEQISYKLEEFGK